MLFPEEIFVKEFLPNIRVILAHELYKRNYSQTKIAEILGITQARINGYLKSSYEKSLDNLQMMGLKKEDITLLVDNFFSENGIDKFFALRMINSYWQNLLANGKICQYHYKMAGLNQNCTICLKSNIASDFLEDVRMKNELKEAFKLLNSSPFFPYIMPQINTNIAYAKDKAEKINDVLAFPGRIIKYKSGIKILADPEFGASNHLAKMLILAHKKDNSIRSCIDIKFDKSILKIIKELEIEYNYNLRYDDEEDPVVFSFREYLKNKKIPRILIDDGRKGYESICYIFGKNPIDIAKTTLLIAEKYTLMK